MSPKGRPEGESGPERVSAKGSPVSPTSHPGPIQSTRRTPSYADSRAFVADTALAIPGASADPSCRRPRPQKAPGWFVSIQSSPLSVKNDATVATSMDAAPTSSCPYACAKIG